MKKRLVSLLLAFSMVLTFIPFGAVNAFAAVNDTFTDDKGISYQVTGENTVSVKGYTGTSTDLEIPAKAVDPDTNMEYDVTEIATYAFMMSNKITGISLPQGLKKIGKGAFSRCSSLTGVLVIPDSVKEIGDSAFSETGITSVHLGKSVETLGYSAFANCQSMHSVDLSSAEEIKCEQPSYGGSPSTFTGADMIYYVNDAAQKNGLTGATTGHEDVFAITNGGTFDKDTEFEARKLAAPEKTGYTFMGWYRNEQYEGTSVTGELNSSGTFYAKWQKNSSALTVKYGTISAKQGDTALSDEEVALQKNGSTVTAKIPEGATVTVTFDDSIMKDSGSGFDQWKITSDEELLVPGEEKMTVNPKNSTITFVMPKGGVEIEAMTKDATIEDDSSEALGITAAAATGVIGAAVLGYTGYQIGTELYLIYLLPTGAEIPTNRTQLAELVWQDAGKPEPATPMALDAADDVKALTWAVETGLMDETDKNGETLAADASVSRIDVIKTWKKAQELKNN